MPDKDLQGTYDALDGDKLMKQAAANKAELDTIFKDYKPLPGAEEFGRAIVDANGVPSGSPANYEYLRGSAPGALTGEALEQAIAEAITAAATSVAPPEADK